MEILFIFGLWPFSVASILKMPLDGPKILIVVIIVFAIYTISFS